MGVGANGGSTKFLVNGAGDQTYSVAAVAGRLANVEINKASGTVSAAAGTTSLLVSVFTLTAGTFAIAASGTLDVGGNFTVTGGTFTPNSGTLHFNSTAPAVTRTIDVPTSLTLAHLKIGGGDGACGI
ncbi:MAG: hypothetical protein HYW10_02580 [Candidatus Omnitrophica bacterium]|nr:hypothetical protein [Candidatus Omnitrophota bacterium]